MGGPRRSLRLAVGIAAVVLGLLWLGRLYLQFREGAHVDGAWVFADSAMGIDLQAYLLAAERVLESGSPYAPELVAGAFAPGPAELYYYAPQLSVALTPLVDLDFADSTALWWAFRVVALLTACALMPVTPLLRALAFAVVAFSLPGLKDPIIGNVSLLLVLPMVLAWRWIDRPLASVAMALAISLRPSLGLFLVWQLLRRRWRAAAWTVGAGLALVLLALPFVGLDGHLDYLAVVRNLELPTGDNENRDLGALMGHLGASEAAVTVGRVVGIGLGLAVILFSLRRERDVGLMVVLCSSLLVMPLLWSHYLATLIVPAAFLAQRLWPPLLLLPLASWVPVAAPLLVVATIVLLFLVRDESASPKAAPAEAPAEAPA